ncbi:DUF924 family protein [Bradyrhizobium sp. WD16]|uniref:DUF924 family protein n=1 Tax=Bradyrhizobium sp. WD16 TaxID=1521768 RepID=UPI0020A41404|nr:DUF924 family protein [Bradyrhizobium sp. WD16]UTD27497.1 hypothetical protein DB459_11745 [Bradyrhizobium sp. WD16]
MAADLRCFLYMPLVHSESAADQTDSVALFDALGRTTTVEEQAFFGGGGFSG